MQKVDLNKVLEMLINEEHNEAQGLLHEWFVEMSKNVHESIMQEDDQLSKDIEDDQEAIESEEFYSEAEDDNVEGDEEVLDGDDADELENNEADELPVENRVEDLEAEMARLKAEFNALIGVEEPEHGMDIDGDGVIAGDEEVVKESAGGEFFVRQQLSGGGYKAYGPFASQEEATQFAKTKGYDQIFPASVLLPHELAILKAEKNYGKPDQGYLDIDIFSHDIMQKQAWELEGETEEGEPFDPERWENDMDYQEYLSSELDFGTYDVTAKHFPHFYDSDDSDIIEVGMDESLEDFADLEESFNLEPVADPKLGDKEIGASGAKVAMNTKSPLPNRKGADRVGGAAVEIKSDEHKGYDREPAPEVKTRPLLKNQVKKATDGRTSVSKEGDKSAMLNKKDGFGSDSPKSPIGGGAADLRGSDFKRK